MQNKNITRSEEEAKIAKIDFEPLSKEIVDIGFKIHQSLGAGMLECIYEDAFLDILIDDCNIVELKSQEKITNAHTAQILTYLRSANYKLGFIINLVSLIIINKQSKDLFYNFVYFLTLGTSCYYAY